jgi:predicted SAM-dependent methyltransferase
MKLELGCGERPTAGFLHQDITPQPFVTLDFDCLPWEIELSGSVDEILALGVVEHLSFASADLTFKAARRMLEPGSPFLFDVPDLPVWCGYLMAHHEGRSAPFPLEHILSTLFGWQRWPGDEHKSGWTQELLETALFKAGFHDLRWGVEVMLERGYDRRRMHRPEDAHLYVEAR